MRVHACVCVRAWVMELPVCSTLKAKVPSSILRCSASATCRKYGTASEMNRSLSNTVSDRQHHDRVTKKIAQTQVCDTVQAEFRSRHVHGMATVQ